MKKNLLLTLSFLVSVVAFGFNAPVAHAEDYKNGILGTPNVSITAIDGDETYMKAVISGNLSQIAQDDIGGRWTRTVHIRLRMSTEAETVTEKSDHEHECKVGSDIGTNIAQNHFECTKKLQKGNWLYRLGSNGSLVKWTAYMHNEEPFEVSTDNIDTTGGDKTGDTSPIDGVGGEKYQIPYQAIVGKIGSISGGADTITITAKLNVINPTINTEYRLVLGRTPDQKGTFCSPFKEGARQSATEADISKKMFTFEETWMQDITDGIYCIGLMRNGKPVVASFPAGIVSVGSTIITPTESVTPVPNQYGCLSTDNSSYCMMSPLPGLGDSTGKVDTVKGGFEKYMKGIIQLVMGIIGVLAVLMIVVGGIKYMSTVSIGEKEGAKSRITNALVGLLLALSSYTILNTINPDLVNLKVYLPEAALTYSINEGTAFVTNPNESTTNRTLESDWGLAGVCSDKAVLDKFSNPAGLCTGNVSKCTQYAAIIDRTISDKALAKFLKVNMVEETACDITRDPFDRQSTYGIFQQSTKYFQGYAKECGVKEPVTRAWLQDEKNVEAQVCMQAHFINSKDLQKCGRNWRNLAAAQAAGPQACLPSADCANPGDISCAGNAKVMRWECLWDDPAHKTYNTGMYFARYASKKMQYCLDHPSAWMN